MLKHLVTALIVVAVVSTANYSLAASGRDYISIVGSSTVYPFATKVAEQFGKSTKFKTPKIESTGSGGGMKLFCAGIGVETPDITNASRRITTSEFNKCQKNGVKDIVEIKIGYDGIVIANSKKGQQIALSLKDIFLALAKDVPNPNGVEGLVSNPYKTWRDVNSKLPDINIEVLGPPPTSGTRDAFSELIMEGGCETFDFIKAMKEKDPKSFTAVCHAIREDGAYIEAGENDNLIVQKLEANPESFGIFGFSFLDQNGDQINGALIDNVAPSFENIADGEYPISRPLFFYVKKAHVDVIPGMREYLIEFTNERAWGTNGYLSSKGLIPAPEKERKAYLSDAKSLKAMKLQ